MSARTRMLAGLPHSAEQDSKCYHKAAGYRACRAAIDRQATTRPNRNPHSIKSAAGRDKNYWVMSYDDLADLAEYATKNECFCCDGAKNNCRLRQILKELPIQGVSKLIVNCWREE